jgi:hypothetical protein
LIGEALLLCLVLTCALMLVWGLRRPGRVYEFPFLAAATFAAFALPQLLGLMGDPTLPSGAIEKTLLMSLLCVGMCHLGYITGGRPMVAFNWTFTPHPLLAVSAVLTAVGSFFFWRISRLPVDILEQSQWTGLPVAYLFFASMLTYGFALSSFVFASYGSRWSFIVAGFGAVFYLDRILLAGRRGDALEFLFIVLLAWWFRRRKALPRIVTLGAALGGALVLHSTGEYRAIAVAPERAWSEILDIDYVGNVHALVSRGGDELRNATFTISAADDVKRFTFGLKYWNDVVFAYVPAQIVGRGWKERLMVDLGDDAYARYSYVATTGSTTTGLADSFASFWYFGCLIFFFIARILRRIHAAAMRHHFVAQLLYALMIKNALHAITHHTGWFLTPWIHIALFMAPALLMARGHKAGPAAKRGVVPRSGYRQAPMGP